jgi:hypothetical protein
MSKAPSAEMMSDGNDLYIVADGVKIAKRGRAGTPQARTWISLEPGWRVLDQADGGVVIERDGESVRVQ